MALTKHDINIFVCFGGGNIRKSVSLLFREMRQKLIFPATQIIQPIIWSIQCHVSSHTVYPKKYAHGFVVLCFVVVMQSFVMNSHEVFIHIHQGCFAGTRAIVRLPQCQCSKPDGYGKISQCITTTKHSKAKTVCIFLGIYCMCTFVCFSGSDADAPGFVLYYLVSVLTSYCWYTAGSTTFPDNLSID